MFSLIYSCIHVQQARFGTHTLLDKSLTEIISLSVKEDLILMAEISTVNRAITRN